MTTPNLENLKDQFKEINLAIINFDDHLVLVSNAHNISEALVNEFISICSSHLQVAVTKTKAHILGLHSTIKDDNIVASGIEARIGVTSGISVADRTKTLNVVADYRSSAADLVHPGHIFPAIIDDQYAILHHKNHSATYAHYLLSTTEKDSLLSVPLFSTIVNRDGEIATMNDLKEIILQRKIPIFTANDLVVDLFQRNQIVSLEASANLPMHAEDPIICKIYGFVSPFLNGEHFAVTNREIIPETPVYVRVQNENLFQDIFAPDNTYSRETLHKTLNLFKDKPSIFVYLRNRYSSKVKKEIDSIGQKPLRPNAMKNFGIGAQIIKSLGAKKIIVVSNSNSSFELGQFGLEVVDQIKI